MEPKQPENQQMPDFHELTDRMISEKPSSPMLVIKTNLDPKDSTEENPYYDMKKIKDPKAFKEFFDQ
jgi:hypothetical protein